MMRLWNRLLRMDDNRVAKKVFEYDVHTIGALHIEATALHWLN